MVPARTGTAAQAFRSGAQWRETQNAALQYPPAAAPRAGEDRP